MPRPDPPVKDGVSFEEYLEFETASQVKHEFVDGRLFLLPSVTDRHNRIAGRVYIRATLSAEGTRCDVYMSDVIVRTPNGVGYYPDVFGLCDPTEDESRVKRRPCFIVEVLSDSTEAIDRGEKLANYTLIPSLQTYVLVSQLEPRAEVYSRLPEDSWRYEAIQPGSTLRLPCVNLELPLEELYVNL